MDNLVDKKEFKRFYWDYCQRLNNIMERINVDEMARMMNELLNCWLNGHTVFLVGNGGSAATCAHMANDLGTGVYLKSHGKKKFRVISLVDNIPIITSIANDWKYEDIFERQLELNYSCGDLLMAVSASGNSENLLRVVKWVKQKKGKTIGVVGFDGGRLKELCDVTIHLESDIGDYGPVEDVHMIINHLIASWLLKNEKSDSGVV